MLQTRLRRQPGQRHNWPPDALPILRQRETFRENQCMKSFPRFMTSYLPVCLLFGLATLQSLHKNWNASLAGMDLARSRPAVPIPLTSNSRILAKGLCKSPPIQFKEANSQIGTFPLPMKLAPGKTVELPVIFTPTASGRELGNITLTNTGQGSQLQIKLAGTGVDESSHSVALSWQPGDQDYVGFNIYRSTDRRGAIYKDQLPTGFLPECLPTQQFKVERPTTTPLPRSMLKARRARIPILRKLQFPISILSQRIVSRHPRPIPH